MKKKIAVSYAENILYLGFWMGALAPLEFRILCFTEEEARKKAEYLWKVL